MHHNVRLNALERMLRPVLGDMGTLPIAQPTDGDGRTLVAANSRDPERSLGPDGIRIMPDSPSTPPTAPACDSLECGGNQGPAPSEIAPDRVGTSEEDAVLTRMADSVKIIRAADGRHYAAVSLAGGIDYFRLESQEFRRTLFRHYHVTTGRIPRPSAVANLLATLRGRAEVKTDDEPVYLRVARDEFDAAVLIDLSNAARRAVSVSATGWRIVAHPGVPFWRPPGQRPFPTPQPGGSIELLKKYLNLAERQWPLLIGWLTTALRPRGPYPLLVVTGEQGAAKSTLTQVCRRLVDPQATSLRAVPRSERDLMVSAHNNWLLTFDNISSLTPWQSDALCRLSTGGGYAARGLFTDDREVVLNAQRPIILNGIDDFVTRGDLTDRSIFLSLRPILPAARRSDHDLWTEFERDYPAIFGALLDAVAGGIRCSPEVELTEMSRMADLDRWGEAVLRGLGSPPGTFVDAYHSNRVSACADALEPSPLVTALFGLLAKQPAVRLYPRTLLLALGPFRPKPASLSTGWPSSPWALSVALRRLAPQLREIGILVESTRRHGQRIITVARRGAETPSTSE
jgi:hypothetical protein